MTMEIIRKYFSNLTDEQQYQFEQLAPLYEEWNAKINVISRKDIDHLYEHHVLHSLAIAKEITNRQYRQESKSSSRDCRPYRSEKRRYGTFERRKRKGKIRFCGKQSRNVLARYG